MTRLSIFAVIVLALAAGPQLAFPQDTETMSVDELDQLVERTGDLSALWEQIIANADAAPNVPAAPVPETPDLLPGLWERIKANADAAPNVPAAPVPETPDLLPGLWEQIKANADQLK